MSGYTAERIEKPIHFRIAPLVRGRGKRHVQSIGFDSEQDTETATPMLYQFSLFGSELDVELCIVPEDNAAPVDIFMSWLYRTCTRKDTEYIVWAFNLQYEFTQMFGNLPSDLNSLSEYEFAYRLTDASGNLIARYLVRVMNDKR